MTPKEKASELIVTYQLQCKSLDYQQAKQCTLIAVDEIIKTLPKSEYLEDRSEMVENRELIYWEQVKQEIKKL